MQRPPSRYLAYALIVTLAASVFSMTQPLYQTSNASHENITVNIGIDDVTDTYDPGDYVSIEGVIDEVEENEDVTVRVKRPSGTTVVTDTQEPGSGGVFDFLYQVPSNADEGVWAFEVDYDGEKAYTYFIVDDEDDTIFVVLDETDGIYEAGSEVIISGSVDDVGDELNVEITVLDPFNDEIVDEAEAELGDGSLSSDEFEYEFGLPSGASHGRYAVLVTYENQEGSILFEIEDDDAGSGSGGSEVDVCSGGPDDSDGDLSAELEDDMYAPGDTVCVSGTIEDYDDSEEAGIIIEDPEGEEIEEEDDVTVDEDGSDGVFEFEFDLDDDAPGGDYTIVITYANDEVELTFEVEAEEDEDEGVSESGDLTVRLNKRSYQAGETLTVTGAVEDVDDEELVNILMYRPTGQVVLEASRYVEPESNGDYTVTTVIPSHLEPDDDYVIMASYLEDEVEITFDITGVSETPEDEITIETDEDAYDIGSTVEISGDVPDDLIVSGQPAFLRVNKPDGNPCRLDQINIPTSGSYSYELVLGGECGIAGEYEVTMTYRQQEAGTTFELIGFSVSRYNLNVDNETYPIEYEMTGGGINSMFIPPNDNELVLYINAEDDGQLTLVLPREVIDAVKDGEDVQYVVTITDIETGEVTIVEVEESENTDDARTIVIDYEQGADLVEIVGTQVVPEFGQIAAIVMALSIFGIIMATARFSNRFNVFGQ